MAIKTFFSGIMLYILVGTRKANRCQDKFKTVRMESKKISNDQELIQSDPKSCPQNQMGNN